MKPITLTLLLLMIVLTHPLRGEQVEREQTFGSIHLVEMHESEAVTPLFTITGIEATEDALLLTVVTANPARIAMLIGAGRLTAECSSPAGTASPVSLQLWRKCRCPEGWVASGFDVLRTCADLCGQAPAEEQLYLVAAIPLVPGIDLGIGYEPDSIWLIERQ